MKASEIISKKVYSISEGCEIGYILNFSLDEKLGFLDSLIVASLQEENEFVLSYNDISSITEDAVFINSSRSLLFDANFEANNPVSKKMFSISGEFMGKVVDVEINKNVVKKIISTMCEVLPKHIFSSGKDCLFFSKNKAKKFKIIEKNNEIVVKTQEIQIPSKETDKGVSLIGKRILKDVLDENHIILFRKNEIISPKILIEAKRRGQLKKLEQNCN